jgi:hypothetical protein
MSCFLPVVSRPSMLIPPTVVSKGTSGCAAYQREPSRPDSSAVTAMNSRERAGRSSREAKARASSSRAAVPLALSTAPL